MNLEAIAKEAGVSRMTVSRALRNHPEVSHVTRDKVMQIAKDLGYSPNPMVSVLMSQVAQSRKADFKPTLVYSWEHSTVTSKKQLLDSLARSTYEAIESQANSLGFKIDPMRLREDKMSDQRFSQILRTRGTPGLIIAPSQDPVAKYNFDLSALSAVAIGYSIREPRLDRVALNYYGAITQMLNELWNRGYRRFGLILRKITDERILHLWSSGFLTFHWERNIPTPPNILIEEGLSQAEFTNWFKATKPEVIFSYDDDDYVQWARSAESAKVKCPSRFIHLDEDFVQNRENLLGSIPSSRRQLGLAAINLLVGLIKQNATGIPEHPQTVVVEAKPIFYDSQ